MMVMTLEERRAHAKAIKDRGTRIGRAYLVIAVVMLLALSWFAVWFGDFSPIYRACMARVSPNRFTAVFCNLSLLSGGLKDYMIMIAQWALLGSPVALIWVAGWHTEKQLAPRRIKDRARRAARKAALQSTQTQSE
uniref:hypothetical protein n=1 Tax=Sphingomonas bacterium TaxID=1895847 RepID=UPI00262E51CE|nr:hypothetical protein [Sphingomonas bacterium]